MSDNQTLGELSKILIDYFRQNNLAISPNFFEFTHRPWVDIFIGKAKEEFFNSSYSSAKGSPIFSTSEEYISWVCENGSIGCKFRYLKNENLSQSLEVEYAEKFKILDYILGKLSFGSTIIYAIPHKVSRLTWLLFIIRRATSLKWFFYRKKFIVRLNRSELIALHVSFDNSLNDFIKYAFLCCIPVDLLEAFPAMYSEIKFKFRRYNRCISAHAIQLNTPFKILASIISDNNGEIISLQHGGGYGMDLDHFSERYERKISSKFYYWGEGPCQELPCLPLPALRTRELNSPRYLLLVCMPDLYSEEIMGNKSDVLGGLKYDHKYKSDIYDFLFWLFKAEVNFNVRLPPNIKKEAHYYKELKAKFPSIKFDDSKNILDAYKAHKVVVHTYMGTGWLESLMMGVNTLVYEKHNKINPKYAEVIQVLRDRQILFSDMRELFSKITSDTESSQENLDQIMRVFIKYDEKWDITWDALLSLKKII